MSGVGRPRHRAGEGGAGRRRRRVSLCSGRRCRAQGEIHGERFFLLRTSDVGFDVQLVGHKEHDRLSLKEPINIADPHKHTHPPTHKREDQNRNQVDLVDRDFVVDVDRPGVEYGQLRGGGGGLARVPFFGFPAATTWKGREPCRH